MKNFIGLFQWLFSRNIYAAMLYRLGLAMLLFTLCRVGFYLYNTDIFTGISLSYFLYLLYGGLKFDLSALLYINSLFILMHVVPLNIRYNAVYQKVAKYLFFITNGFGMAMNVSDFIYYRFTLRRTTSVVFGNFEHEKNLWALGFRFIFDYWYATLFFIGLLVLMVYLYRKFKLIKPSPSNIYVYHFTGLALVPLIAGLMIAGFRGGFRHSTRPITLSNAAKYVRNPKDVNIVLNTPFAIFRTLTKKELPKPKYFTKSELDSLYNPHYYPKPDSSFSKKNVVIIIIESFAREYIGALNKDLEGGKYEGYTPFMDSLIQHSLTFKRTMANGRKSIDAMPSILASVPSLETPYVLSHYSTNRINGMAGLLRAEGYRTAFFHGAPNGSMGFDAFANASGFENYYGMNEYGNSDDFDGIWGVWDDKFFQFLAKKLNSFKQPFFVSMFSVSSHHPFKVPVEYEGKFKKGPAPILQVVGYTDYSLRHMFNTMKKEPWFENTLFVITADHTNESVHKEYKTDYGYYCVPIIFYEPGSTLKGIKDEVAQQIDIMPTVLNYLGYDKEYIAFGNDLFDENHDHFAINTTGSTYQIIMDDFILQMLDGKTVSLFDLNNDILMQNNLINTGLPVQLKLENKLKAVMQSYDERLVDDNMVVK